MALNSRPPETVLPQSSSRLEKDLVHLFVERQKSVLEINGEIPIRHLWNPDTCPAVMLPYLACALSVDAPATEFSEDQLRALIKVSLQFHQRKGTVQSIKDIIEALGYRLSRIEEGTDGHWAKYRVVMESALSIANGTALKALIEASAPLSRELASISYDVVHQYDGTIKNDGTYAHGVITP